MMSFSESSSAGLWKGKGDILLKGGVLKQYNALKEVEWRGIEMGVFPSREMRGLAWCC